jgi:hypothetical protein
LFALHASLDELFQATRACTRAIRVAALPSELTASFRLGSEDTGVLAHNAGPSLGAERNRSAMQMQLMKMQQKRRLMSK